MEAPLAEPGPGPRNQHVTGFSRTEVCPPRDVSNRHTDVREIGWAGAADTVKSSYGHHAICISLSDDIQHVADSNCRHLRSSSSSQLVIRHTRLSTDGDCAFPVAGSCLWNSLPPSITSAPMLFLEPPQNLSLFLIISFPTAVGL